MIRRVHARTHLAVVRHAKPLDLPSCSSELQNHLIQAAYHVVIQQQLSFAAKALGSAQAWYDQNITDAIRLMPHCGQEPMQQHR